MPTASTVAMARDVRQHLAGSALTERQAKLYSQRLRLDMGQAGLVSFAPSEVEAYLDEAVLLVECALIERRSDPDGEWRAGLKRAAEILEWLSQSSLKPQGAPLHLLSAAAYQTADYPAMALGQLRRMPDGEPYSALLREFLGANFPDTLEATNSFWREQRLLENIGVIAQSDLATQTIRHVVMCIGTICAYLRTGSEGMNERALKKLESLAAGFLHSRDPHSYLLARLVAAACRRFVETCLWPHIDLLRKTSSEAAGAALVQFARSAFANRRALIWPAQATGIARLRDNDSFVLCTPTGSGKTTVATLAVVQGLFADPPEDPFGLTGFGPGNLVLYLVPSRALAAEIEHRFDQDLKGIAAEPAVVTGLYGGVDWGPTDAWLQTDRATIVICTFEKADALMRYLGVLFLDRVRLVVLDEVHMVEQRQASAGLRDGSSRAFRLEQLGARLLRARDRYGFRVVALSAVAARAAPALARWIGGDRGASPVTSSYRSTRQMLGRLEVGANGQYSIHYDLMDGRSLRFDDERGAQTPYVRSPFPPLQGGLDGSGGPEVRMRKPTLWAALQLAAERPDGSRPSVLISLTQNVEAFSATCADLMDRWPDDMLPNFRAVDESDGYWIRCLASAADYFTVESVEYRLLRRGIAVHHGKMPGLLARRLKAVIDRGYVRVIVATSTLSEGVNIAVNHLLIPSVCRGPAALSLQEFTNLIGRAGRPGVATEGSALVVLPERVLERDRFGRLRPAPSRQWGGYESLVAQIETATAPAAGEGTARDEASSPLASLLQTLEDTWAELTGGGGDGAFEAWLEQAAIAPVSAQEPPQAYDYLDTLDGFLIAAIQEVEELRFGELSPEQVEIELANIWRHTYAFAARAEEDRLGRLWLARGRAIKWRYPDALQRRRIYKTSLSPRFASFLLMLEGAVRAKLTEGGGYARWGTEARFAFVRDILALLAQIPIFRIEPRLGKKKDFTDWPMLLRWWVAKSTLRKQPEPKEVTTWYAFVAKNFIYRGAWGLGSIMGLILDSGDGGQPIRAIEMGDWARSGLPWISFWLKELITWGTLDPVAAFLLARGLVVDRPRAEEAARGYYASLAEDADPNNALDPRSIRDWVEAQRVRPERPVTLREYEIDVRLVRPAADYRNSRLTVAPLDLGNELTWIDSAGYTVARSDKPFSWPEEPASFNFELVVHNQTVVGEAYLPHS